jgi:hypothetical protein
MPLGATPSRWCVCQFHHFRSKLLYFQPLAGPPRGFLRRRARRRFNSIQRPPEGRRNASSLMLPCPALYCNVNGSGCSPASFSRSIRLTLSYRRSGLRPPRAASLLDLHLLRLEKGKAKYVGIRSNRYKLFVVHHISHRLRVDLLPSIKVPYGIAALRIQGDKFSIDLC